MFDRIISVDWSGAASEGDGVDLRVATFEGKTNQATIVDRQVGNRSFASWSRQAFRAWIVEQLRDERPALIAMDFGFGLPWRSDEAIFGVNGWRPMLKAISKRYHAAGTSRAAAERVNAEAKFSGHGPYRFDDSRNDYRFYIDHQVAYYRQTELVAPQGISQWYLGSGGTVGFHTISGLSAIDSLIEMREAGEVDFVVWPQETLEPDGLKHVLVESYPAICPVPSDFGPCRDTDGNQKDAWKVLQMLISKRADGTLGDLFRIQELPFGRYSGISFVEQVQFEGWILGLR
jgi:hypothetical protein